MDRMRKRIDVIEDQLADPALYEKDPDRRPSWPRSARSSPPTLAGHEEKWLAMSAEYEEATAE